MTVTSPLVSAEPVPEGWTQVSAAGQTFLRRPIHTRWLTESDDLAAAVREHLYLTRPMDTVAISEKVVVLLTGRTVDLGSVHPGWLARMLAQQVRPRADSCGLSVPEKMEYVVRTVGAGRVLAAAAAAATTRALGLHGTFYRLAGSISRDIDGGRPPYEHVLFPPLESTVARHISADLERELDIGVAIVDLNDFGGSIRAVSPRSLRAATLRAVLADNPMRQRRTGTPFVIVRPTSRSPAVRTPSLSLAVPHYPDELAEQLPFGGF